METSKCGIFILELLKQLETVYEYGAEVSLDTADPDAVDCSELVQYGTGKANIKSIGGLPVAMFDGAANQFLAAREIPVAIARKQIGSLLFRQDRTAYPGKTLGIGHVGVVIGPEHVLHASSSKGKVVISRITDWWNKAAKIGELYGE